MVPATSVPCRNSTIDGRVSALSVRSSAVIALDTRRRAHLDGTLSSSKNLQSVCIVIERVSVPPLERLRQAPHTTRRCDLQAVSSSSAPCLTRCAAAVFMVML